MNIPIKTFEDWLKNKNLKDRTIENYIYYFNKFMLLPQFDQENVSKFLSQKGNRNTIARAFLVNFQKFLTVNYESLGISQESRLRIAAVELPKLTGKKSEKIINPIPHEQIPLLEKALPTEKEKLQLLLSYYCALRLGELLKIRIIDFNWEKWKKDTSKMGECKVFGKGDREGIALVPSALMGRIGRYIKSKRFPSLTSYIFINNDGRPVIIKNRAKTWQDKLAAAGKKTGITKYDAKGKPVKDTQVHPHRLRHSYASYLLNEKGLNMREVQEVLRHANIQNTQRYTHINKENLKEKLSHES